MKLIINGENLEFNDNLTLLEVINKLEIESKVMAVAVNTEVIKKESWNSFKLKESDRVELLNFVGGGWVDKDRY